jgi:hypothetical protein
MPVPVGASVPDRIRSHLLISPVGQDEAEIGRSCVARGGRRWRGRSRGYSGPPIRHVAGPELFVA